MREDSMNHNEHLNHIFADARSINTIGVFPHSANSHGQWFRLEAHIKEVACLEKKLLLNSDAGNGLIWRGVGMIWRSIRLFITNKDS
jgi:hypothetical protein